MSVVLGFLYAASFTIDATTIFEVLSNEFAAIGDMGPVTTMLIIFFNNALKTALVLILGIVFGILPTLFVITNGFIVGVIAFFFHSSNQISLFMIGVLPHGVLEIPAFLIASAIGLKMGSLCYKWLFGDRKLKIKRHLIRGINVYTHAIIPLFFIAALIETYITAEILNFLTI